MWLARSVTGALRAVKVVRREDFELDRTFEREFEGIRKFEPISRDHPGLVHVLHVGRNDDEGFYYYVMELGDDRDRGSRVEPAEYEARTMGTDRSARRRLSIEECVQHGITIADALAHLHAHGLTHRDIKPSNIIFVNGKAKLADIGLVAAAGQNTFVGTEGFVPPEGPGTAAADIYSLGMVLYEMSTGNDRLQFPELPDDLGTESSRPMWRALNDVVCKACAPNPRKRYSSARQMADALRAAWQMRRRRTSLLRRLITLPLLSGLIAFAFVTWRHGGAMPWPPGRFHGERGPFIPVTGSVTLTSEPAGADVVLGDRVLGRTPLTVENVPPGEAVFTLRRNRHRDAIVRVTGVTAGSSLTAPHTVLQFYNPPVVGQPWENSLRMPFDPRGGAHISRWPVSYDQFRSQLEIMSGSVINEDLGEQGVIYMISVPPDEALRFCDLLTGKEIEQGFLPEGWCYRPERYTPRTVRSPLEPELQGPPTICFRCVAEKAGQVVIESDPPGANVYEGGKLIKVTPFTISNHRTGPVKFTLRLEGYEETTLEGDLAGGGTLELKATLPRSRRPVPGQPWQNSLGMRFQPVEPLLFSIWETRVSDYKTFADATGTAVRPNDLDKDGRDDLGQDGAHPVINVTRADALAFCRWLTEKERQERYLDSRYEYRLPTDSEWSLAAGAPNIDPQLRTPADRHLKVTGVYPWLPHYVHPPSPAPGSPLAGANLGDLAAVRGGALRELKPDRVKAIEALKYDDGMVFTAPVGSFRAGESGIMDLSGNVWEFVADDYGGPRPEVAKFAVTRGGSWASLVTDVTELNTQYRRAVAPDREADSTTGFRVVVAPTGR